MYAITKGESLDNSVYEALQRLGGVPKTERHSQKLYEAEKGGRGVIALF